MLYRGQFRGIMHIARVRIDACARRQMDERGDGREGLTDGRAGLNGATAAVCDRWL